jgi:type I restriction enzyme, S subunit
MENLKRAAMRELFTRGLRGEAQIETEFGLAPETWEPIALDECAAVQTGVAKGRKFSDAEMVDVPYLRVANVQDGHLDLSEMKEIHIRRSEVERYRLQPGDVVLTEGGDFDKLGRGFIWRGELDLCVHQNHVFAVRPDRTRLLPEFFAYLAQSAYGKAYFLKVAHKTTNLACINSTKLKAFPVLVPPTADEQQKIVDILEAIDRKIDLHCRKKAVLEELFKALLHKLMTGEIRVADLDLSALRTREAPE